MDAQRICIPLTKTVSRGGGGGGGGGGVESSQSWGGGRGEVESNGSHNIIRLVRSPWNMEFLHRNLW